MDKVALRKKYKALRNDLSKKGVEDFSLQIANKAIRLPIWEATYYHIFLPIETKNEVNTEYLLHILNGKDKSIVVSKSDFETFEMNHFLLQENTKIKISTFGIPEPVSGLEVNVELIDVVFIPLLAFDKNGRRLGYGKGFYDRFLARCNPSAIFIGLSFFEAEETIAHGPFDIPLHYCVTPSKVYDFRKMN